MRRVDGVRPRHRDVEVGPHRVSPPGIDLPRGAEVGRRHDHEIRGTADSAGAEKQHGRDGPLHVIGPMCGQPTRAILPLWIDS